MIQFLLGYPLAIIANFSTIFLQSYFKNSDDITPLETLFINSFIKALKNNKKLIDQAGTKSVNEIEKEIKKDPYKLFSIIKENLEDKELHVLDFRKESFQIIIIEEIFTKFKLGHINVAKNVLKDCLDSYQQAFYKRITIKDGIKLVVNLLDRIETNLLQKKDIDELKDFILLNLENNNLKLTQLIQDEISDPESIQFSKSISSNFGLKKIIKNLTEDQYDAIHFLRYQNRVIIKGCAGSGKTLVASEKAIRLDNAGIRTLLLTHNPNLVRYIKSLVKDSGVVVKDFTNFIYELIGSETLEFNEWNEFSIPTQLELYKALNVIYKTNLKYDAIIIDEGQDFRENWWLVIESISEISVSKIIYIFCDDNQSLIPFPSKYPFIANPFNISKNCRNAGNVFKIVKKFHNDAPSITSFLRNKGEFYLSTFNEDNIETIIKESFLNISKKVSYSIDSVTLLTNETHVENSILNGIQFYEEEGLSSLKVVNSDLKLLREGVNNKIQKLIRKKKSEELIRKNYGIPSDISLKEYLEIPNLKMDQEPTNENINAVVRFANRVIPFFKQESKFNDYTNLSIRKMVNRINSHNGYFDEDLTYSDIAEFYSNNNWFDYFDIDYSQKYIISSSKTLFPDYNKIIRINTINGFKGLESDCVILFVDTMSRDLIKELYIGTSRAVEYLHLVINASLYKKLYHFKGDDFNKA